MVRWTRVYAVACSIFVVLSTQAHQCAANTTTLRLLVMLNLGTRHEDSVWTPRWDRGLELLPAAQLAVDRINQDPTILPGPYIITEMDTGACDHGYPSDALFEFGGGGGGGGGGKLECLGGGSFPSSIAVYFIIATLQKLMPYYVATKNVEMIEMLLACINCLHLKHYIIEITQTLKLKYF